jgi:hypothetical protein
MVALLYFYMYQWDGKFVHGKKWLEWSLLCYQIFSENMVMASIHNVIDQGKQRIEGI